MTKKVVIVGVGAVGSTCAYTLLLQEIADTVVLVDINKDRTQADSLDMAHALPFTQLSPKQVISGEYDDAADADIVIVTANAPAAQLDVGGDGRLALLKGNVGMIKEITTSIMASGFDGIFLIASNPVDLIARIVAEVSGLPKSRVIGTGTLLDSARMKTIVAEHLLVNPNDINGCVMGEHGNSSFTAWSNTQVTTLALNDYIKREGVQALDFDQIDEEIRQVGFDIFQAKGNTSYGIASALATVARAIFRNERTILPVSSYLSKPLYDVEELYIGMPTLISKNGAEKVIPLELTAAEQDKFRKSAAILKQNFDLISDEL
jgi:L-lactate dehydrogenase